MSVFVLTRGEKTLLRMGNLVNVVGVFRALSVNNYVLSRERFEWLVKKNYFLSEEEVLPDTLQNEVLLAWKRTKTFLEDLGVLLSFSEEEITCNEPRACFQI